MGIATSDNGPVSGSQLTNENPASHDREPSPRSLHQVVVIEPTQGFKSVDFHQLWAHRELLYFLVWKDLKIRYKQTALGLTWVLLQPLFMTVVFTLVLGKLIRVPSDGVPYPVFVYAGIMLWTFFSGAVLTTSNCLITNTHLFGRGFCHPLFNHPLLRHQTDLARFACAPIPNSERIVGSGVWNVDGGAKCTVP
jgi:hypothetical protein